MIKKTVLFLIFFGLLPLIACGEESSCVDPFGPKIVQSENSLFDLIDFSQKITEFSLKQNDLDQIQHFIDLSASLIERGYAYDQDAAEDALYNFVMDYKRIVKSHKFTDEELLQFFEQSELSTIISKGIIGRTMGDLIVDTFTGGRYLINDDPGIEALADHFMKPKNLNVFVSSKEGKSLIDDVKKEVLLPALGKKGSTDNPRDRIHRDIAVAVFTDLKDYGVSERFTELLYRSDLVNQFRSYRMRTEIITLGIANTEDVPLKYNWEHLRKTSSGRKAIEKFGRDIVAQALAGNEVTDFEIKKTRQELAKLLDEAMSEVEDE